MSCLLWVKQTPVAQGGTRSRLPANQKSRQHRAPRPPCPASTNRGHPCTTQAAPPTRRPRPPPAHRSPPPPATGPRQRRPPASRRPPHSPRAHLRPRHRRQLPQRRSHSRKRTCRSRQVETGLTDQYRTQDAELFFCCAPQRDQMYAAQEMFKTANKVTRPEKALILGFMAGSRGKLLLFLFACFFVYKSGAFLRALLIVAHPASCPCFLQRTRAPSRATSSRSS